MRKARGSLIQLPSGPPDSVVWLLELETQWPLLDLDTRGHQKADMRLLFILSPFLWFVLKVGLLY